jgi:hypothetical protein
LRRAGGLAMRHVEINPQDTDRSAVVVLNSSALGDPANRRPLRLGQAKLDIPLDLTLSEGVIESRLDPLAIVGVDAGRMVDGGVGTVWRRHAPDLIHFR